MGKKPSRNSLLFQPGNLLKMKLSSSGVMLENLTKMEVRFLCSPVCSKYVTSVTCPTIISVILNARQDYFKRRVAEAKRVVRDSTQTNNNGTRRLRLRVGASTPEPPPQRLTLKLPGQKAGVTKEKKPQSGMSVDNESLKRQQDLVKAGSNGQDIRDTPPISRSLRRPPASPTSSAGKGTGPQAQKRRSSASSPPRSALATVKSEAQTLPSPSSAMVPSRENSQESGKPAAVSPGPISSAGSAPRSSIPPMPPPSSITRRHQSSSPCHLNNPAPNSQTGLNSTSPLDSILWQPGKGKFIVFHFKQLVMLYNITDRLFS